jgi:SAM-dependent methyltransferase
MSRKSRERPRFPAVTPTRFGHPNEGVHNRIGYRVMEQAFLYSAEKYASGRLVDIGCGSKPWKALFAPYVDEHIGVDRVESGRKPDAVDVVATAYDVPLPDGYADTILFSSVIEHLEDPHRGMQTCSRLLAPGGYLIMTAPFFWPIHEAPYDFYRFSPYALRELVNDVELELVELVPLSGAWTTFALELSYALRGYRKGVMRPVVDVFTRGMQWSAARWDRVDFQPKFSWSHLVIARAPGGDEPSEGPPAERS